MTNMNFSQYIQLLHRTMESESDTISFTRTIFEVAIPEEYYELIGKPKYNGSTIVSYGNNNTIKAYYNGRTGVTSIAKRIKKHINKRALASYIKSQSTAQTLEELCKVFKDYLPEDTKQSNVHVKLAELFSQIIHEESRQSNKTHKDSVCSLPKKQMHPYNLTIALPDYEKTLNALFETSPEKQAFIAKYKSPFLEPKPYEINANNFCNESKDEPTLSEMFSDKYWDEIAAGEEVALLCQPQLALKYYLFYETDYQILKRFLDLIQPYRKKIGTLCGTDKTKIEVYQSTLSGIQKKCDEIKLFVFFNSTKNEELSALMDKFYTQFKNLTAILDNPCNVGIGNAKDTVKHQNTEQILSYAEECAKDICRSIFMLYFDADHLLIDVEDNPAVVPARFSI